MAGSVLQGLAPLFEQVKQFITSSFSNFASTVFNQLTFIKDQITGALVGLPSAVAGLLGGVAGAIQPFFTNLSNQIVSLFNTVISRIVSVLSPALQSLQGFFSSGLAALQRTLSTVATSIQQALAPAINAIAGTLGNIPGFILDALRGAQSFFADALNRVSAFLQTQLNSLQVFASATQQGVNNLINGVNILSQQTADAFGLLGQIGANFGGSFLAAFKPIFDQINNAVITPIQTQLKSLFDAPRKLIHPTGSITPEDAVAQVNSTGPLVLGGQVGIIAAGAIGEVLSLGQLDQVARAANDAVGLTGIDIFMKDYIVGEYSIGVRPAFVQSVLRKYTPLIPGPGDLVQMVVREAFVPELRTPAPDTFAKFMELQGFSRFWSDTFWTAHWTPIEFQTAVDMFHRGIIDRNDLLRRLIILDFRPDDAEKLQQLIFRLPNRVEARIMARFGLLTDEQLTEIIRSEGVKEEFVEPLRVMMQEFNLTSIFTKTETAAISAFEDGLINESQLTNLLTQIRRPPNVITQDISLARFKRELEFKRMQIKTLSTAQKKGYLTPEQFRSELTKLQLDQQVVGLLAAAVDFEQKFSTSDNLKKQVKQLSVGQVNAAVKKGTITTGEALDGYQALGYDPIQSQVLLSTALA